MSCVCSTMFPVSLSHIYDLHCDFLQKLEERLINWKRYDVIGDVFSSFVNSPQVNLTMSSVNNIDNTNNKLVSLLFYLSLFQCKLLSHYQQYVNEFPSSLQLIKKQCRSSVKMRKLIKVCGITWSKI